MLVCLWGRDLWDRRNVQVVLTQGERNRKESVCVRSENTQRKEREKYSRGRS